MRYICENCEEEIEEEEFDFNNIMCKKCYKIKYDRRRYE